MALIFDRSICRDIECALNIEWLVTNGLGGYASSTIVGANTRRYHGLLVAAPTSPRERLVLLSKLDEEVESDGVPYYLGTNEYTPATIHPCGFVHLEEFRLEDGLPVWTFRGGEWELEKRLWMAYGQNTTYISYTLTRSPHPVTLTLRSLVNYRNSHRETKGRVDWDFLHVESDERGCCVLRAFDGAYPYALYSVPQMEHIPTGVWYWNFLHRRERERGLDYTEDLYAPGVLRRQLAPGEAQLFVVTCEPTNLVDRNGPRVLEHERGRRRDLLAGSNLAGERAEIQQLVLAADQFIVQRAPTRMGSLPYGSSPVTVIAGYPWFGDWGRDTMIALPGLMLATRRYVEATAVLRTYARYVDQGMLPNRFPESGETPEYNTVDATLWFFVALWSYVQETGDTDLAGELYPLLVEIVDWHIRGTRYGIQVDPADGLLRAGAPGAQLTWMDAKVEDWVVTPRQGKPVEVNALWYNALRIVDELGRKLGRRAGRKHCRELAKQAEQSFLQRFWYALGGYLYDVVDGPSGDDAALRPNQLLALSLPFPLLSEAQAGSILRVVGDELLTPYGLRSLAPRDSAYHGHYEGDIWQRDSAYHQGTVWAWLIGPYLTAMRRVFGPQTDVRGMLEPLLQHLKDAGVGTISEILDGDPPFTPRGCIAQAWSVAEVLRVWRESGGEAGA
jgi:predicted glycogen debranching enzyme